MLLQPEIRRKQSLNTELPDEHHVSIAVNALCKWQSKEGRPPVTTKCHRLKLAENAMHETLTQ